MPEPTFEQIRQAHHRIAAYVHRTPVMTNTYFNDLLGGQVFFKCENLQKTGAFKFRGATNAVMSLTDAEAAQGVITHSSGNHGQALASAAGRRGVKATVVMPRTAKAPKKAAVTGYGGQVVLCEPGDEARAAAAKKIVEQTGATFIHSSNDPRIIAGQGTSAIELLEDAGPLDLVIAPVGGGGLISGAAVATKSICPHARVIAAEPAGADDAKRSLDAGRIIASVNPQTVADGLLTSLGNNTFAIMQQHVDQIVTVADDAIIEAMQTVWHRMKIVIEPSSAVPVAALMQGGVNVKGKRVGVILSGGNVDLAALPWVD